MKPPREPSRSVGRPPATLVRGSADRSGLRVDDTNSTLPWSTASASSGASRVCPPDIIFTPRVKEPRVPNLSVGRPPATLKAGR